MSHEPECTVTYFPCDCCEKTPCACEQIRSAYQRGREDAVKAIENLESNNYDMVWVRLAVIAARGDGEQE